MKIFWCALLGYVLTLPAANAGEGTWPTRPIKLIVPTGPGAATDVMARMLSDGVSRTLAQSMVVENVPGASGILAHQAVARAAPDGYTFLFTSTSGMAINPISFRQLPYDPTRDFTAVAMVCNHAPQMVSVNAELPAGTLPELIAYAKANAASCRWRLTRRPARPPSRLGFSTDMRIWAWSKCLIDRLPR